LTPESAALMEELKARHPGCVGVETVEGLLVVRRPSTDEVIGMEDAMSRLKCQASQDDPYAGMDLLKRLIVAPDLNTAEEWLNSYPGVIEQVANMARIAAFGPTEQPPILYSVDLTDGELYVEGNGQKTKRHGGKIFVVEHTEPRDVEQPFTKPRVLARYLMRRLGLSEHREAMKETAATGHMMSNGVRLATMSQLARIARKHVCVPLPDGCTMPDFEAHPYLLKLLGQAVINHSRLTIGSAAGKSKPS